MHYHQSPQARRWLYQAELLIGTPEGNDEQAVSRRSALDEAAVAMVVQALQHFVIELVTLPPANAPAWPEVLALLPEGCAERERLQATLIHPEGELHGLHLACCAWQAGQPLPPRKSTQMIASSTASLPLDESILTLKRLMHALRESAQQW